MFGLPLWAGMVVLVAAILAAQALVWVFVVAPIARGRLAAARRESVSALAGAPPRREGTVRSLGEEGRGRAQVRGTGHLAVTDDAIVFVLAAPRRVVRIPRSAVTEVGEAPSHLGRRAARPLLRVAYARDDGAPDAIAFDVGADLAAWREAVAGG